jgi:hypothetical protein
MKPLRLEPRQSSLAAPHERMREVQIQRHKGKGVKSMRLAIALGCVAVLAVLGMTYSVPTQTVSHQGSPAFQTLLGQAIARLEGAPQRITAASVGVGVANADDATATVDEYTCEGFRTCDARETCNGSLTCDGEVTCWASTCDTAPTCECDCLQYTLQGCPTCDGTDTCMEGCAGWPTYYPDWPTCAGEPTCNFTCPGYVSCSGGPSGTDRTTWGDLKMEFAE